ncbi:4450_t:CDS:2 [Diversispora eburnea]|uniref:4450_t:CDS:1 n=1 Tax=Diversispora eburnea TaxID=1213867 RepID=A0A9N8ZFV2_9GLOM|nr:4450_t:CDS:2 [Diversispora eburnea]
MTKKSNSCIFALTFLAFQVLTINGMSGVNILNSDHSWYICSPIPVNAIEFTWEIIDTGVVSDANGTLVQNPNPSIIDSTSTDDGCYGIVTNTTGLQDYLNGLDFVFASGLSCINKTKSCTQIGSLTTITPLCLLIVNPTTNYNYTFQYSLFFYLVSTTTSTTSKTTATVITPTIKSTPNPSARTTTSSKITSTSTSTSKTRTKDGPLATNDVSSSNRVKSSIPLNFQFSKNQSILIMARFKSFVIIFGLFLISLTHKLFAIPIFSASINKRQDCDNYKTELFSKEVTITVTSSLCASDGDTEIYCGVRQKPCLKAELVDFVDDKYSYLTQSQSFVSSQRSFGQCVEGPRDADNNIIITDTWYYYDELKGWFWAGVTGQPKSSCSP